MDLFQLFTKFLDGFCFGGLGIVVNDPIVKGKKPELTILAFVTDVRWVWLRKHLQPNILQRLSNSNCVMFLQGYGVENGETGGRLDISWCTRCRVSVDRG